MFTKTRELLKSFAKSESGNIAVITAIAAVPIMVGVTLAMDNQNTGRYAADMQAALDVAALATIADATLLPDEREAHARAAFKNNFESDYSVSFGSKTEGDRIDVWATAKVPTLMGALVGQKNMQVRKTSAAKLTKESITCLLTLDPHGENALQISGNLTFSAPNCAVQVNSDHPTAMVASGPRPPSAQSFCVTGGKEGDFLPFANTECNTIADPYANLPVPPREACKTLPIVSSSSKGKGKPKGAGQVVGSNLVITPGTYCGGLTFSGTNIDLKPGIYHVTDGPIIFAKTSEVYADDVTFVMEGPDSRLEIEQNAVVDIRASKKGTFGGLAFFHPPAKGGTPLVPEDNSFLKSGGRLNVTGVIYLPTHEVSMTGQAGFGSQAPATSFIVHRLKMSGRITANIKVDYEKAGIPPMLPRVDGGPILVH